MRGRQNMAHHKRLNALLELCIEVASGQGAQGQQNGLVSYDSVTEHNLNVLHFIRWYVVGTTTMRPNISSGLLTVIP